MSAWGCSWGDSWGNSFGPIDAWGGSWAWSWNGSWRLICPAATKPKLRHLIPRPDGLSFSDWASVVTETFANAGIASPPPEEQWQDWACSLFYDPGLCAMNIPTPETFPAWQPWAEQFVEAVR